MGAVADGGTDNTAVIQKALEAAARAEEGFLEIPAGRYRLDGTLSIPAGVTLQGTYRVPPRCVARDAKPGGLTPMDTPQTANLRIEAARRGLRLTRAE